jgi:tetratricopeptide (TPR) repeat protein
MSKTDNAEGVKLYQQGNYLGAVNSFQQALAKQPGNPDTFYNLGATYHQQAKLFGREADQQTAEQYYHLCLARNPSHEACQRALAVLLGIGFARAPSPVLQVHDLLDDSLTITLRPEDWKPEIELRDVKTPEPAGGSRSDGGARPRLGKHARSDHADKSAVGLLAAISDRPARSAVARSHASRQAPAT